MDDVNMVSSDPLKTFDDKGFIEHRPDGPWVNAPLELVLSELPDKSKSKARTQIYLFGVAVLAVVGFYAGWESKETAVWLALLGAAVPVGALILAAVRTFPGRRT